VPGVADAGYSQTPLAKKLGVKSGTRVALVGAPDGFAARLEPLPDDVRIRTGFRSQADLAVVFSRSRRELDRRLPVVLRGLAEGGNLWLAWPKLSSGLETDLREGVVRATALAAGLVDFKVAAIDETWSGLRFARRR
jgi:hypothetical protein